jgi:ABC-2 type transport system ATP-binding protein
MDVLSGLVRPSSGKATIFGHDVVTEAKRVRARIGVVPQETALYDELNAIQNLEFSAALYGAKDAPSRRIASLLELVGLTARARDRVGTLSGGMRRRLTIARALLHDPELLLLDEPTLGVDAEARHQIWNHVRSLRDAGRTVLLATNYLDEAEALCDSVSVLRAGRIVANEAPGELVARAGLCLELVCADPDAARLRSALSADPRVLRAEVSGERVIAYFAAKTDPDDIVRAAMAEAKLTGFRVRSPDLMEVLRTIGDGV